MTYTSTAAAADTHTNSDRAAGVAAPVTPSVFSETPCYPAKLCHRVAAAEGQTARLMCSDTAPALARGRPEIKREI